MTIPYSGPWLPEAFSGKQFSDIDFSNRCLVGADFSGSVCKDCDFTNSDLSHANFSRCDLYRAKFNCTMLYATRFDDANLTRADFDGSFTYGWLLNASATVTYAKLLKFDVEKRRRKVLLREDTVPYIPIVNFGQQIGPPSELCLRDYQVGIYRFCFTDLDREEMALQRSQIYGRLKRLYRENQNGEAALHCAYYERYYLTRSYYRHSPLTGGGYRDQILRTIVKTFGSRVAEFISGYGLRPVRIVRNLFGLMLSFFFVTALLTSLTSSSGVIYYPPITSSDVQTPVDLGKAGFDMMPILQYAVTSSFTADPQRFAAYGIMVPLGICYFVGCAILFALLFSSVFLRILSD